jgi:hypothetical protein
VLRLPYGDGAEAGGITDASAEAIASLRRLRELDLSGSRLTDAGLARLAALKGLAHLDVSGTSVKNPMPVVVRLKKLRYLGLDDVQINDDDLKELAKRLPALRELNLGRNGVTRFRLAQLLPKTKWKKIHLELSLAIDDAGEGGEVKAFEEFCRDHGVFVEIDYE